MKIFSVLLLSAAVAGCAAPPTTVAVSPEPLPGGRPLEVLQPGFDAAMVRSDLLSTARERFGESAVQRALSAKHYIVVKRFYGMGPPPPPGAPADWKPVMPAALLMFESGRWHAATPDGWRDAKADMMMAIDQAMADPAFWSEEAYTPPCPDYGADLLLVKLNGREALRQSLCMSKASAIVASALRA